MSHRPVNPSGAPPWGAPSPPTAPPVWSPASPPLSPTATTPGPPVYGTPAQTSDLVTPRTSGAEMFGGFVATALCWLLAALQTLAGIGMASDTAPPDRTPQQERYLQIYFYLWTTSIVAWAMVVAALVLTISVLSHRERRWLRWLFIPLVVNLVLCIATWAFGVASFPE